jgi:hypothetical protein
MEGGAVGHNFERDPPAKLKIAKRGDEILIVHCCFSVSQNELKFLLQLRGKE